EIRQVVVERARVDDLDASLDARLAREHHAAEARAAFVEPRLEQRVLLARIHHRDGQLEPEARKRRLEADEVRRKHDGFRMAFQMLHALDLHHLADALGRRPPRNPLLEKCTREYAEMRARQLLALGSRLAREAFPEVDARYLAPLRNQPEKRHADGA